MLLNRLLWLGVSMLLLALAYRLSASPTRACHAGSSASSDEQWQRKRRVLRPALARRFPAADRRFDRRHRPCRSSSPAPRIEMRYILKSPAFLILLLIAFAFTLPELLTARAFRDAGLSAHVRRSCR